MTTPDTEQISQVVRQLWKFRGGILRSLQPLRLAGYCLLLLGLFDLGEILIPPVLLNPRWEFNAFGQIIERVPVMLIGLAFIFIGGREERLRWESLLLKVLSWLCLVASVSYLLLMPLGVVNTWRIDRQNQQQIESQIAGFQEQASQAKTQVDSVRTQEDLVELVQAFSGQNLSLAEDAPGMEDIKEQIVRSVEENEAGLVAQAEETLQSRRRGLLEKSVKWNLGTLVASLTYFFIWRTTGWTRSSL